MTDAEALEALAKRLHWKQWHLDPDIGEDAPPAWDSLSEFDQHFFKRSVEDLIEYRSRILIRSER
jgi:hypothetical protein